MVLPNEILQMVCEYLPSHSLYNFCLASRTFELIGRPYLWAVLAFGRDLRETTRQILVALRSSPQLALLVKAIHLDIAWSTGELSPYSPDPDSLFVEEELLDSLDLDSWHRDQLTDAVTNGIQDGYFAILLILCKNVERVTLPMPWNIEDTCVASLVADGKVLNNVRFVTGGDRDAESEDIRPISKVQILLTRPLLEEFHGWRLDCKERPSWSFQAPLLHTIELRSSMIAAQGLEFLLQSCPNLGKMLIIIDVDWYTDDRSRFAWTGLGEAIGQYGKNLRSFTLSFDESEGPPYDTVGGPLAALRTTRLEELNVPTLALFDYDQNPSGNVSSGLHLHSRLNYLQETMPSTLQHLQIQEMKQLLVNEQKKLQIKAWMADSKGVAKIIYNNGVCEVLDP